MQAKVSSVVDHGEVDMYDGMTDDMMSDIIDGFSPARAKGISLDELLGGPTQSSPEQNKANPGSTSSVVGSTPIASRRSLRGSSSGAALSS